MKRQKLDIYQLWSKLERAISRKFSAFNQEVNVLPDEDVDFAPYFENIIPQDLPAPKDRSRGDMVHYKSVLRFESRGQAEIMGLNMLLISYLRRNTPYTKQAWSLFERLWENYTEELLETIRTRDLISSLRTFADHAEDDARRLSAKLGFTYAHMIKLYESERVNEGYSLEKGNYSIPKVNPSIGLEYLWGVRFGGDNSFEIQNVILAEEVMLDPVIGPMLLSVLSRFQNGDTIFSRFDRARFESNFKLDTPRNWSYGFNPYQTLDEGDGEA